ncbi:MAG TPA: SCO family protein [Microthrixaceae bacterium]|nr:SCO family protein [Microthrixaceae bacterium]
MTRLRSVLAVLVLALLAAACTSDSSANSDTDATDGATSGPFQAVALAEPTEKPDFVLTDTDGNPFDFRAETEGVITLLFFGYTNCPDICPPHLAQIAQVLDQPGALTNVKVVFVTVDPERDTPEVLRDFLDSFDRSFIGLTGDPEVIRQAQIDTGVPPAIVDEPDEDGDYLVGHSGEMRAYAPNGLGYVTFPFGTRQSQFAHDLQVLDRLRTLDDQP